MSETHTGGTGLVGIMGHRSWIAKTLMAELRDPIVCPKSDLEVPVLSDYSRIDCLYLFAGRSKGSVEDLQAEIDLCLRFSLLPRRLWPRRLVYVSSRDATDAHTEYGRCKRRCELELGETFGDILRVVRPGAVFGPQQPIDSPMLVPSLAREGLGLNVRLPSASAVYIPVAELVGYLVCFIDLGWDGIPDRYDPDVIRDPWHIPGSFTATGDQLRALWTTWESYRRLLPPE